MVREPPSSVSGVLLCFFLSLAMGWDWVRSWAGDPHGRLAGEGSWGSAKQAVILRFFVWGGQADGQAGRQACTPSWDGRRRQMTGAKSQRGWAEELPTFGVCCSSGRVGCALASWRAKFPCSESCLFSAAASVCMYVCMYVGMCVCMYLLLGI
ncbi:hypothetical protein F4780DRAFT_724904 [Xylariomycetidae sp. FL0641]|nr:hypothetical protein F4780DRAFT_724904 [Xylariomycetidae sp. FL0641]